MLRLILTAVAAAAMLWPTGIARGQWPGAGDDRPSPIEPRYLYNGVGQELTVTIRQPRAFGPMSLVLMDHDGAVIAGPVDVRPGVHDLGALLPELWSQRRTCYAQILVKGEASDSALVLQPMLSREVPVTQRDIHPVYDMAYTRIVGWRDENAPDPSETSSTVTDPDGQTPATETSDDDAPASNDTDADDAGADDSASAAPAQDSDGPSSFTGFRAYPERDVVMQTSLGEIRIAMRPDVAPNTVWNFLRLCEGGFYRGVMFHRIVPLDRLGRKFVIQAGDPSATGDGGPGYWLPIEHSTLKHDFGVISMARADDPDSAGSQFFFCLGREGTARLDGQYCSFGYAVSGGEVIQSIADVELADPANGRPVDPPVIRSTTLIASPPRTPEKGRPDQRVTEEGLAGDKPLRVPR